MRSKCWTRRLHRRSKMISCRIWPAEKLLHPAAPLSSFSVLYESRSQAKLILGLIRGNLPPYRRTPDVFRYASLEEPRSTANNFTRLPLFRCDELLANMERMFIILILVFRVKWKLNSSKFNESKCEIDININHNLCNRQCVVAGYRFKRVWLGSSSDLKERRYIFKRVRNGFKIFRALRAPALS